MTLIGLLAYFNSLSAPFHYDDVPYIRENIFIKSSHLFSGWIAETFSRIITGRAFLLFTFYLNYIINGLDTFGYHIVNLLIHISTAFLFYLLIAKYVDPTLSLRGLPPTHPSPSRGEGQGGGEIATPSARNDISGVAILAATLFLLHPINTESVTYISSRSSVLSAFFILASMLCFFRATDKFPHPPKNITPPSPPLNLRGGREGLRGSYDGGKGGFNGRNFHAGYYILSIISFLLGLSTKEASIVTPALILLFDIYFISNKDRGIKTRLKYHLPFWLIVFAGSFYYLNYIIHSSMYDRPWLTHILTEIRVFVQYLKLLILPLGLNLDHDIRPSTSVDPAATFSLIVIIGLIFAAFFFKRRNRALSFSIFWFFINLAPFLIIRLEDYMAERWVYAALLGFSLGIGMLLITLYRKNKKIGIPAIAILTILFGTLTHIRNNSYNDPLDLWTDAAKKSPEKSRPYTNLCVLYAERNDIDKAIEMCKISIEKGSDVADTYINLATAYFLKGNFIKGESVLLSMANIKEIRANDQAIETYHYNLGGLYRLKKEYRKAMDEYKKALKINPRSPAALAKIGECYSLLGMKDEADEYFRQATNEIPQNGRDYIMLAKSFYSLGERERGIESLNRAVIMEPFNVNIRFFVATIQLEAKSYDSAYKHFSVIAKLSPNLPSAYTGMGKAKLAMGNPKEARKHFNKALSLLPPDSPERKDLLEFLSKVQN